MPRLPPLHPPPPFEAEADLHMEAVVIVVATPGVPHGGVLGVRGVRAVSLRLERLESCKIQEEKQKCNQYRNGQKVFFHYLAFCSETHFSLKRVEWYMVRYIYVSHRPIEMNAHCCPSCSRPSSAAAAASGPSSSSSGRPRYACSDPCGPSARLLPRG